MKVTQQELKQIIKEELAKVLKEGRPKRDPFGPGLLGLKRRRAEYAAAQKKAAEKLKTCMDNRDCEYLSPGTFKCTLPRNQAEKNRAKSRNMNGVCFKASDKPR